MRITPPIIFGFIIVIIVPLILILILFYYIIVYLYNKCIYIPNSESITILNLEHTTS